MRLLKKKVDLGFGVCKEALSSKIIQICLFCEMYEEYKLLTRDWKSIFYFKSYGSLSTKINFVLQICHDKL